MFTEYISEVKESAFKGLTLLGKRTFGAQIAIALVFTVISTAIVMLLLGSEFQDALLALQQQRGSGDPTQVFATFQNLAPTFAAIFPITLLLGALQYAISFRINDTYIKTEQFNIGQSISDALKKDFLKVLLYSLLIIGLFIVVGLIVGALIAALAAARSFVLMGLLIFVLVFVLAVLMIRTIGGYAFLVHGNQGPVSALQSSFTVITTKRALIILVVGIALGIGMLVVQWLVGTLLGLVMDNALWINQVQNSLVSVLIYSFLLAGISSFYFRYTDFEASTSVEEHLLVD